LADGLARQDEWVKSFKETASKAAANVQRKLDQLLKEAYRDSGKDPSRLPSDRSAHLPIFMPSVDNLILCG
jgi:hypothetical protein